VHLVAKAADLVAHVGADVLALLFDETRKLSNSVSLFFGMRASIRYRCEHDVMDRQALNLQGQTGRRRICKAAGELRRGVERLGIVWICHASGSLDGVTERGRLVGGPFTGKLDHGKLLIC
jgi:hypothetical protein